MFNSTKPIVINFPMDMRCVGYIAKTKEKKADKNKKIVMSS